MKILRVAQKLYPEHKGGGAYHVHAMSRDQADMGHDVTVLTVSDDDSLPRREERDGYTVVRARSTAELLGNTISVGLARELRKANDYDVIHAHSHIYFSTNLAALKGRMGEIPLAITNHGLYSQTAPKRVFDFYLRTLGCWTFNQADIVFTYTESEKQELSNMGVASEIVVVSNGVDTDRFTPNGPADERLESPAILFAGRLVDGKRPIDAVHALTAVCEEGIDADLYVAGTGPLESKMRRIAAGNGVGDSVTFLNHIPYDEMPAVYRAADVLVLPSRDEGVPRTVLEAMATGTPVVTSDLPQLRPLTDQAGCSVAVGDQVALGAALVEVLDNSKKAAGMAQRGRELVTKRFGWIDTVATTTKQMDALCN